MMTEYRDPRSTDLPPQPAGAPASPSPYGASGSHSAPSPYSEPVPYSESVQYSEPVPNDEPVLTDIATGASVTGDPEGDSPSVKDKAADSAQAGKQAASEVAQTATDKAKEIAQEAKTQTANMLGQVQDQLREQASTQQKNLVTNLRSLGDQLNSMAERGDESGQAKDLVAEAGSRAHSAAAWLDDREPGQLLDELRSFARRKPGVFVLGALAAGLVAGRLTRGVVAGHQDASDDSDTSVVSGSSPQPELGAPTGYPRPGYGSVPGVHSADVLEETRP
jgi:hypothetical protein